ncbi:hypothetical protein CSA56_13070 [candidate division KSB3 bacterium]|uniref:TIGR03087 family PEP-CTERM/XrtA system glycosyltransferase n=1 Tax=candidate division KSB3 bacterium TaxID=2044937 RepID=A0A2G6KCK7_9BACT|nr:MAG: hypothetical protein CSA56_13070 [candidate division KSB3 bacterium]
MNILYIAHRIPYPPNKGDKIRSFNEIKFLSKNHRIWLCCLTDDKNDLQYVSELQAYCQLVDVVYLPPIQAKIQALAALCSRSPLSLAYFFSGRLQSLVNKRIQEQKFDAIVVYSSSMAQYVEPGREIPKIMDFVDIDSDKWAQYARSVSFPYSVIYRLESARLKKYETVIANTFQHSIFVSFAEADDFRKMISSSVAVSAVVNGIDTEMFCPSEEPYEPHRLVFTGAMDYFANVETVLYFVKDVLPLIQKEIPDVTFYIVGSKPAPEILQLGKDYENITVTGFVDQVRPYVVKSAVFVAPMKIARGINNKILEAMAMGVPVVTSSLGFKGLPETLGDSMFVEDAPRAFAEQVVRLLEEPDLRVRISEQGRRAVEMSCSWEHNLEKLEDILLESVKHSV